MGLSVERPDRYQCVRGAVRPVDEFKWSALSTNQLRVLPTACGKVAYVFGTRIDPDKAGTIVLMHLDAFRLSSITLRKAENFKPIEGYAKGEWYATAGSISFGYPERVAAKDIAWALESGAKALKSFAVNA